MRNIGTVNGYVISAAWFKGKKFEFDGTLKGLVLSAIAKGAMHGDIVHANFGGRIKSDAQPFKIVHAPHDDRANFFWAEKALNA